MARSARSMRGHASEMADFVLRVRARPTGRRASTAARRGCRAAARAPPATALTSSSSLRSSACGSRAPPTNARSSTRSVRRAVRPLRRQPRRGQDAGALDARHDEARAVQRMRHGVACERERHGCRPTRTESRRTARRARRRRSRNRSTRLRTPASASDDARASTGRRVDVSHAKHGAGACRRRARPAYRRRIDVGRAAPRRAPARARSGRRAAI